MLKNLYSPVIVILLFIVTPAHAYIGPGAGLGAIGVAIALFFGLLLLIIGFIWYPMRRYLRKRKEAKVPNALVDTETDDASGAKNG